MYLQWAESMLEGKTYFKEEYHHPPGYAAFLAPLLKVSGFNLYAVLIVQSLLLAVQSWLVFYCGKTLFGVRAAWISFFLYSLCGPVLFYSMKILSETLYSTLVLGSFYFLLRFQNGRHLVSVALSGLLLGAAMEVRGNATILVVPSLAAVLMGADRWKEKIAASLVLCAGIALFVTPVLIRNIRVAGAWTPVASNWGENFYFGNHSRATGGVPFVEGIRTNIFDQITDVQREASKRSGRNLSSLEAQQFWFDQGLDFIKGEPVSWLKLEWIKFRRMLQNLLPSGIYSYQLETRLYHPALRFTIGYAWLFPLFAAGLPGLPWNSKTILFLAYTLLQIALLLLYWPEERYLLPVIPFLLIGAGCIGRIGRHSLQNKFRVAGSLALILFCLYVNLRPIRPGGLEAWYSNASAAHYNKQEFPQAQALALEALRIDGRYAEAWTNLGSAMYSQNRIPEARKAWLQALSIKSDDVMALRNLAISYEKEDPKAAVEWWNRTLTAAKEQNLHAETIALIEQKIAEH